MFKKILFACIGLALLAAPFAASALSVSDLQAQVQALLARIEALQASTSVSASANGSSSITGSVVSPATFCPNVARSLSVGSTGSDVTALQQFLSSQGFLNVSATGYFGVLTKAAVEKWQAQNGVATSGNAGLGIFGPLSRAFLVRHCGGTTTSPTGVSFTASPTSGLSPLAVQFTETAAQGMTLATNVNFGDGSSGTLGVVPVCSSCSEEAATSHTYSSPGTYTATLTSGMCSCPEGGICNCPNMMIVGTATVTVTGSSTTSSNIQQLNAPGPVTLSQGGIAEIRNENYYFTLESLTSSTATIQPTPVGCWNSFPSDPPPQIRCMIAIVPIPPQTLSIGQSYASGNYSITLSGISNGQATFSIGTAAATSVY